MLALVIPASARERKPEDRIRKLKLGSRVVVTLKDKETLKGRLGKVTQDQFTLKPLAPASWSSREILFQDIRDILPEREHSILDYIFEHDFMIPIALVILPFVLLYCGAFHQDCGSFP